MAIVVNIDFAVSTGYLVLPTGALGSGAGVCPKHVQGRRIRVSAMATPLPAAWQRVARTDFATIPSASLGRVT
ncbi:hypothetical protein ACTG9Q_18500 [Actinokineospora sp. 24-640]